MANDSVWVDLINAGSSAPLINDACLDSMLLIGILTKKKILSRKNQKDIPKKIAEFQIYPTSDGNFARGMAS